MLYSDFVKALMDPSIPTDAWETYGMVNEGGTDFPLIALHSPSARHVNRDVIITAGFHGEEPAGPLTIMNKAAEIINHAKAMGVSISIYPCINPSGFEDGRRYNRSGESPNNAFLEYEIRPGTWIGELPPGFTFRRTRIYPTMTKETKALYERIKDENPLAVVDLHQDEEFSGRRTYAYVFGTRNTYVPIIEKTAQWGDIVCDTIVDNGSYGCVKISTDSNGLTEFNDGSIIDYFWRRGTDFLATIETTTSMRPDDSVKINMTWVKSFIDLASERKYANP